MTRRARSPHLLTAISCIALASLATAHLARAQLATSPRQETLFRADAPILPSSAPDPSLGNSFNYVTGTGINLNGVGIFQIQDPVAGFDLCTASRIGPWTMITAAHCVSDENTGAVFSTASTALVGFRVPGATQTSPSFGVAAVAQIVVDPFWHGFNNPTNLLANDIAILQFNFTLPSFITTYNLFTGDPVGKQATLVGDGTFGGPTGAEGFDGRRRWGTNRVDYQEFGPYNDFLDLYTDFDDPNDPLGTFDTFCHYGVACDQGIFSEAALGEGDSGGPLFVNGQIAGINSFSTYTCDPNFLPATCVPVVADPTRPYESFGSLNGFAPIAANLGFIRAQLAPEPSTIVFVATGLAAVAGIAHRRRRRS